MLWGKYNVSSLDSALAQGGHGASVQHAQKTQKRKGVITLWRLSQFLQLCISRQKLGHPLGNSSELIPEHEWDIASLRSNFRRRGRKVLPASAGVPAKCDGAAHGKSPMPLDDRLFNGSVAIRVSKGVAICRSHTLKLSTMVSQLSAWWRSVSVSLHRWDRGACLSIR